MARLVHEDGTQWTSAEHIARELAPLGVRLARWPVGDDPEVRALLDAPGLDEADKERVLAALERYFEELQRTAGYRARDLVVLHGGVPDLDELMARFETCHTHAEDEVRYIIDGEGVFGFVRGDGSQVELLIEAEEYINVPAGTEHWFHLTGVRRIKAVRYFTSTEGWAPHYTGTPIRFTGAV